jgi:hypothetical protein
MTATVQHPAASSVPSAAPIPKPKKDPRYTALRNFAISISAFNAFGYGILGFEQPYLWPVFALLTGYSTEIVFELISSWSQRRRPRFLGNGPRGMYEFLLPSHISALAVNMLLYANNQILPVIFGVFVAVSAKHAFQAPIAGRMRHFMNPSNFGIAVCLLCFGNWLSIAPPYEFTENANTFFRVLVPMIILTAGTVLNAILTKKTPLIVGWLGAFMIQAFVRHGIWNMALFSALGPMTGTAFILFTNYMITDPGTSPGKPRAQFMFGSSVAFVYAVLMQFNVVYTLFFATGIVCSFRGLGWWGVHFYKRFRAGGSAPGAAVASNGHVPQHVPSEAGVEVVSA